MVNVDFSSPSFVLGAVLVGIAVTLLQVRGNSAAHPLNLSLSACTLRTSFLSIATLTSTCACWLWLLQLRKMSTRLSQDADIVVAAVLSVIGATLIFQGWRLDPLLLLSQTLTTGVALFYGVETFRLRSSAGAQEAPPAMQDGQEVSWPGLPS